MTKLVEVWTINKSSKFVPECRTHLEMFEWGYGNLPEVYVADNKLFDEIKSITLPIINLRECTGLLNKLGKPEYKVSDRYVAIHPELEDVVAVKYKAIIHANSLRHTNELWKLNNTIKGYETNLDNFKSFPWWKRVWLAFNGEVA